MTKPHPAKQNFADFQARLNYHERVKEQKKTDDFSELLMEDCKLRCDHQQYSLQVCNIDQRLTTFRASNYTKYDI